MHYLEFQLHTMYTMTVRVLSHYWPSCSQRVCGYEEYISTQHAAFVGYRDETIAKWDAKLRLASGKLTNKVHAVLTTLKSHTLFFSPFFQAFVQVDRSTLAQIKHVRRKLIFFPSGIIMCCQTGA